MIKRTSVIGIFGNLVLSAIKISVGFISGSFALIGDGIDSLTDVLTSSITLFTGAISNKPPDLEHPYGHGRAETIATKLLSFIIFFAGAQLALAAVEHLISQEPRSIPSPIAYAAIGISIVGKILLAVNKYRAGRRVSSPMLIADAKNMQNDVYISLSVLIGLFFTIQLQMPILDSITTLFVSAWIIRSAYMIFTETSVELMDGLDSSELYSEVFRIVKQVGGVVNPHKTRIRKLNNVYIIDMDIEVDGALTVTEGHKIAKAAEHALREQIHDIYDVNIHIEPVGNIEKHENFGVSEDLLKKE
ncbi:MAG: cation diffusion facilitator family transporter [Spirochaetia bacterium]|nr:cation diffusion facilitator family transporter [Spirochaetia bacterium]MCF7940304.1 cation diffusion facilitator family transporter [Spirochaetia bacterium]